MKWNTPDRCAIRGIRFLGKMDNRLVQDMDSKLRKVAQIPLNELWRADGSIVRSRVRALGSNEIVSLLREGQIEFVIADVGQHLRWIAPEDCFDFWKTEVKPHLAEPDSSIALDSFAGMYSYVASQWKDVSAQTPIVLLERHH